MRAKNLKKDKNELKIEVEGIGHTLCNILQKELLEDESVEIAGYDIPHPLSQIAIIYIRTKGNVKPEAALEKAVKRIRKTNEEFTRELEKALKKTEADS